MMNKIVKLAIILLIFAIIGLIIICLINCYVKRTTQNQIFKNNEYANLNDVDCIVVFGAAIWGDKPSPMLEDRLLKACELYKQGVAKKIIMSGDHGQKEYDEVSVMKKFAIEQGIPSEEIFMDHAGFSSYETVYRAKEIFGAQKVILVTQEYHLYRCLYIANQFELEAVGVNSDQRQYVGWMYREGREILARNKDFIKCIFKPKPTYLGEAISLSKSGDITND